MNWVIKKVQNHHLTIQKKVFNAMQRFTLEFISVTILKQWPKYKICRYLAFLIQSFTLEIMDWRKYKTIIHNEMNKYFQCKALLLNLFLLFEKLATLIFLKQSAAVRVLRFRIFHIRCGVRSSELRTFRSVVQAKLPKSIAHSFS